MSICEFDISRGYMTKKRRWLFLLTKTTKYPLVDIKCVRIEHTYVNKRRYQIARITLSLASGKKLPLSTYQANTFKFEDKIEAEADTVAHFLSIPKM